MLRASSLGCWPARSQECRAMLVRAMSSRVPSPIHPPPLLDGAAESSGSGETKAQNERSTSDDGAAQKDHDQSLTPTVKILSIYANRKEKIPKPIRRIGPLHDGVRPTTFVLPPPAPRTKSTTGLSIREIRKRGMRPAERVRRLPQKHALNPIPCVNTQRSAVVVPPCGQKLPSVANSVHGNVARKDNEFTHKSRTISHNARSSGTTSVIPTPTKTAKSRVSLTRQTSTTSAKAVEPNSFTAEEKEEERLYITTKSHHHLGRTWRPLPIKPINVPPLSHSFSENVQVRRSWRVICESTSANDAWDAYTTLVEYNVPVPPVALHRMARLIVRERPRASREFTRLLEIIKQIRPAGGMVYVHEWNALIHAAAHGWRKTIARHYEVALSFFRDMTKGRAPGTTLRLDSGDSNVEDEVVAEPVEPDIYTYTTLLGIAARTQDMKCLRHARALLERSEIPPNRFTHLALMTYFSASNQSGAVRSTLIMLERDKMELGLDGINALLSAYSKNQRLDIVLMIYRLLRHNLTPDLEDGENEPKRLDEYRRQLRTEEFIDVPNYLVPNEVTYTSMIQSMAYHGNLSAALTILADMLTAPNAEPGASLTRDADGVLKTSPYQVTVPIFRALFLGFRRHAPGAKLHAPGTVHRPRREQDSTNEWTLDNLQQVLDLFMTMPSDTELGSSAFYWLIVAFQTTSGNDRELVRDVWKRVEGRFRRPLPNRLRTLKASLFSEETSIQSTGN